MQACGPVVRPHEILQTLIISIPQPSAAVKSFFELSRNFVSPPEAMSALLLYRQQTADLPPIQRLAAGGEIYALPGRGMFAMTWRGQWPPSAAGECRRLAAEMPVPTGWGKRGKGTVWFPCPLLTPPPLLCAATPFGRAAKRGLRGLGSVRRAGFGTLLCPEVSLRNLPRITVRGHPVQGANAVAAKSSASIKGVPLEHQTPLWAPRF